MERLGALAYRPLVSLAGPHECLGTVPPDVRDLQLRVLGAIAGGKPLAVVADLVCREAERHAPGVTCAVTVYEERGGVRPIAGPRLPTAYLEALRAVEAEEELAPPVVDLARDPRWSPFRAILLSHGLQACWPYPVFGRNRRPVGLVTLHFHTYREPTREEREVASCCAHLAGLAIEQDAVRTSLEESNHRLDVALGSITQGVCFFDASQRLILANSRYGEIYALDPAMIRPGLTLAEIVAMRVAAGSGPVMTKERYLSWRDSVRFDGRATQSVVELENGKTICVHHQPLPDHGWVATHEDITDRQQAEARILHLARHDPLTGLANRVLFQERLEEELRRSRRDGHASAVLCLDLDRFKPVNDSLGHPAGDKLLKAVAARLLGCVRETDTVTRLGGDEFAILAADLDRPDRARDLAQRVIEVLGEPFEIDGNLLNIGASIGIALSLVDGATPEELFGNADIALYRAKSDQRGSFRFFEAEMHATVQSRLNLERDLRAALEGAQFEVYYQPLVDVKRCKVCSFEALLRWRHPTMGLLAPNTFIPLAEETGLIVPIGAWALQQACRDAIHWPSDVTVSVNLSPAQFKSHALVAMVRAALQASGLPAARLELEITETILLENSPATLGTLHELNDLGIRISMDDFGTGHSSLNYLRSFPFHKIKIDQSFVRDLVDHKDSMAIVRAILGLGRSLDMVTTAEGVETPEQLARLRQEGCNEVQGYLFSQPRPASDIPAMLQSLDR